MIIESPCVSVCTIDPDSGYCVGCNRTDEEIALWGMEDTTDEWKENNLKELETR